MKTYEQPSTLDHPPENLMAFYIYQRTAYEIIQNVGPDYYSPFSRQGSKRNNVAVKSFLDGWGPKILFLQPVSTTVPSWVVLFSPQVSFTQNL